MMRWQVRKAVPFPIEAAQVSIAAWPSPEAGGSEFLVVVARRDIVERYERWSHGAGAHAGLVDLASINVRESRGRGRRAGERTDGRATGCSST